MKFEANKNSQMAIETISDHRIGGLELWARGCLCHLQMGSDRLQRICAALSTLTAVETRNDWFLENPCEKRNKKEI